MPSAKMSPSRPPRISSKTSGAPASPSTSSTSEDIATRITTVVAQAVEGETGVSLQHTSPTMAGVFVRGLTGNKVNVFIDGVRYSNGAQRGGVNTFLDLIEPAALETIEIVRGPSSAQYGSDALGGSVQFLTRPPALGVAGGPRWGGSAGASVGTAHRYGGGQSFVSYMGPSLGIAGSLSGRGVGLARPGDGIDSHAAVTRFLGVPSDLLMDDRLPDTGFHQIGGSLRAQWAPSSATRTAFSYMRTFQDGGDRYDQLLGGDGNLISELNELSLDLFSARLETLGALGFDHASFTYSLNSQREERVNQGGNGNPTATIGHEPERTTVHGVQGVALEAAVAAAVVLARRRRVLRAPDVGRVQRQPGHGRGVAAAPARARRRDVHAGRRVRAVDLRRRPGSRAAGRARSAPAAPATRPRRRTARSSTASRSGRTTR